MKDFPDVKKSESFSPREKQRVKKNTDREMKDNEGKKPARSVSWDATEFIYHEKSADWYWALAIITGGLIVTSVLTSNFLFGILIIIGCFLILLYAAKRPRVITFTVSWEGILVEDKLFPYEELKSFWIFYRPDGIKELSLRSDKMLMPFIKIPLGGANPNEIREILLLYLQEKPQEESLIDTITHWLKF